MLHFNDLQTPKRLYLNYEKSKKFNWTPSKIGIFKACNLLVGTPKTTRRPVYIREKSFSKLIDYATNLRASSILLDPNQAGLYTPAELFELKPRVAVNGWDAARIGMFLNCHLLIGVKRNKRPSLIRLDSYNALIDFANSNLDARKVWTA